MYNAIKTQDTLLFIIQQISFKEIPARMAAARL